MISLWTSQTASTTHYAKIGSLAKGDKVQWLGANDGWSKVVYAGREAWISSKYLLTKRETEAADARRQAAKSKAETAAREEVARAAANARLDRFIRNVNELQSELGLKLVDRVSIRDATATLTVTNLWHVRQKQIRLQDAQVLWQLWAQIASPENLDHARLKLVDGMGNSVGGSRILAGSLIWVVD